MTTPKKSGMGRPTHAPTPETRRQVEALASCGTPYELIARVIDISVPTLTKHYGEVLEVAGVKANAMIAQSLYKRALSNDKGAITAAIFWLKARAGWRDNIPLDETGAPVGKKEIAQAEAQTAGVGTEWGDDLRQGSTPQLN